MRLLAIRVRGSTKTRNRIQDTLHFLHMDRIHSIAVLEDTPGNRHMLNKVQNWVAWGEVDKDVKTKSLKSPKGGLKSVNKHYPKGDLGYRGKEIKKLLERMV